jgi:hypothetical protein
MDVVAGTTYEIGIHDFLVHAMIASFGDAIPSPQRRQVPISGTLSEADLITEGHRLVVTITRACMDDLCPSANRQFKSMRFIAKL